MHLIWWTLCSKYHMDAAGGPIVVMMHGGTIQELLHFFI